VGPPIVVGLSLAALGSIFLLAVNRDRLRVIHTFPELARIPFANRLFGGSKAS
jgi:hypothetical protein